jgi:hypothetical protein
MRRMIRESRAQDARPLTGRNGWLDGRPKNSTKTNEKTERGTTRDQLRRRAAKARYAAAACAAAETAAAAGAAASGAPSWAVAEATPLTSACACGQFLEMWPISPQR